MRRLACSLLLLLGIGACATVEANTSTCFETGCLHGSCQIVGNSAQCVCFPRWTGPTCDACITGHLDRDGDGVCTPACTPGFCTAPHEACVESPAPNCVCAAGYARPPGGAECMKAYGPSDPGFETTTAWSVRGDARLVPGGVSNAFVQGSGFARMFGDGEVYQTFTMPPFTVAGPTAVSVALRCSGSCTSILPRTSLTLDGRPLTIPFFGPFENTFCLGERAFGRDVTLGLRTYANGTGGVPGDDDAYIDRIEFVPSPGCPAPGTVANGDFESDGYVSGRIEQNGNHKVQLQSRCRSPSATTSLFSTMSIGVAQNALAFSVESKEPHFVVATLDGVGVGTAFVAPDRRRVVICLPRWSRGWAPTLMLDARLPSPCSSGDSGTVVVDDLVLTSDPSCDEEPPSDVSFERGSSAWIIDGGSFGREGSPTTGNTFVFLETSGCLPPSRLTTSFTVPDRTVGAGGPAVKFRFMTSGSRGDAYVRTETLTTTTLPLPFADGWVPRTLCLHPESWGHRGTFEASLSPPLDCSLLSARLAIDDVNVGPDPSCPE